MSDGTSGAREALVARVDFGNCVLVESDGTRHEATVRGRAMGRTKSLGNAVVVGDVARFEIDRGRPVVQGVAPRRNAFSRRAAGDRAVEQVVAANVDQVAVVASVVSPEFRPGFVDRVLCQAEHARIAARLVLNKIDLADRREASSLAADYAAAGYAVSLVSSKGGEGVADLRAACRGLRTLFIGHSGVGKSTLMNALAPGLDLIAGHVNAKTGKGRHTTTAAWLLAPEPGFEMIDTPGVRAFGLWGVGPRDLEGTYPEFHRFLGHCRFSNCRHDREPGCALLAAAEAGEIPERRFQSFLKLRAELEEEMSRA
jgi:ribosome biogenesis GTPase / thiamine phosphate phosphatase